MCLSSELVSERAATSSRSVFDVLHAVACSCVMLLASFLLVKTGQRRLTKHQHARCWKITNLTTSPCGRLFARIDKSLVCISGSRRRTDSLSHLTVAHERKTGSASGLYRCPAVQHCIATAAENSLLIRRTYVILRKRLTVTIVAGGSGDGMAPLTHHCPSKF
eukprot:388520-Pleurochrysis_carterae.AAC.1